MEPRSIMSTSLAFQEIFHNEVNMAAPTRETDRPSQENMSICPETEPTEHDGRDAPVQIPADLHSQQTLLFLGLSEITALNIYQAWIRHDSEDLFDFCTFTKEWLEVRAVDIDVGDAEIDWVPVLRRIGAGEALIAAITKAGFDEVRLTKSAFEWVKEAIDMRWEYLLWVKAAREARVPQTPDPETDFQGPHTT